MDKKKTGKYILEQYKKLYPIDMKRDEKGLQMGKRQLQVFIKYDM